MSALIPSPSLVAFEISLSCQHHRMQHRHAFHEFYYSLSSGGVQYAEDKEYPLRAGQLFTLPAGVSHLCTALRASHPVHARVVYVAKGFFSDRVFGDQECHRMLVRLLRMGERGAHEVPMTSETAHRIGEVLREACCEGQQPRPGTSAMIRAGVERMLALLLRDPHHASEHISPPAPRERLHQVFHFIHANYMDPITVEDAAGLAGLSRSHFHALFRQAVGMTFVHYLTEYRLAIADRLLRETNMPLIDISLACGYEQLTHFYRCFRKHFGHPPGQHRETLLRSGS